MRSICPVHFILLDIICLIKCWRAQIIMFLVTELPFTNQTCETADGCSCNGPSVPLLVRWDDTTVRPWPLPSKEFPVIVPFQAQQSYVQTSPHHDSVKRYLLVFSWYSTSSESVKNHVWKREHRDNEYYDRYTTCHTAKSIPATGCREPHAPACLSCSPPCYKAQWLPYVPTALTQ
jgi:hypothetical protein